MQELTFSPGETMKRVEVTIVNDDVYEGLEEFTAELTTTDSGVDIFQPDATARINDDDGICYLYAFSCFNVFQYI